MVLSENELITNMIFCQLNLDAFTLDGIQGVQQVSNLTAERLAILNLFPVTCRSYYLLL
jgi:hypothetical protein